MIDRIYRIYTSKYTPLVSITSFSDSIIECNRIIYIYTLGLYIYIWNRIDWYCGWAKSCTTKRRVLKLFQSWDVWPIDQLLIRAGPSLADPAAMNGFPWTTKHDAMGFPWCQTYPRFSDHGSSWWLILVGSSEFFFFFMGLSWGVSEGSNELHLSGWFMMVYDGLWWFMMVYDGLWWFMMVYDGLWWFMMVYDGLWWFMMVYG